jgi:UDP-N-acetylglucosamine--dolichyl-phosphate N-acetylglucosaminephosphotransferase
MLYRYLFVFIAYVISFGMTFFLIPKWIRYARKIGLVGRDMHKIGDVLIPEAGGLIVVTSIVFSLSFLAAVHIFYYQDQWTMMHIIGVIGSLLCVAMIGVMDDFRGWKIGLKQWQKPLLTLPAALPFLLVNFSRVAVDIPFIGVVEVGVLYPLVFIPIAVVGASNAFNMLAGYNGLETGLGIIILATFAALSWFIGYYLAVVLCVIGVCALCAFLVYNWYPSKIFPGDTLTYPIGAYIAICAVLGRVEKFALILFIPYLLDFLLPLRKKMKVEAFARVNEDGSFEPPYDAVYDSTHIAIVVLKKLKKKVYEKDVVCSILLVELLLAIACIALYFHVGWY